MNVVEYFHMATKILLTKKLRSSLTMLGIIIGNASVITLVGVGEGAQNLAQEELQSLGPHVLFVIPGNNKARQGNQKPLVLEDAEAIASQVPSVQQIAPQIRSTRLVSYASQNIYSELIGTNSDFMSVRNFHLAQGRFITNLDLKRNDQIIVLGAEIRDKLFGQQNPINQYIRIENKFFRVVGIMKSKGSLFGANEDNSIWLPLTTMANRIVGNISPDGIPLTSLAVSAKDINSIPVAQFQITNLLRLRHKIIDEDDFRIQTQKELLKTADKITNAITIVLVAIGSISLLVGGIGIMNIMLVSVSERTSEIGLRKAVGASEKDILIQFLIEAIILAIAGGLIGIFIGITGNAVVTNFTPLKTYTSPLTIMITLGFSGGIGLFFGVLPAQQASKLEPIVALRSA